MKHTDEAIRYALEHSGPLYDEDAVESVGGQRQFDPRNRAGWGTIETGRFKTISHGRGTGDDYKLPGEVGPDIALCESPHCAIRRHRRCAQLSRSGSRNGADRDLGADHVALDPTLIR